MRTRIIPRVVGLGLTGTSLTDLERQVLSSSSPSAVVLFARNIEDAPQLRALVSEIKAIAHQPPLIMIDEEGGRVDRLRNIIPGLPSAESFQEGEEALRLARWSGQIIGRALRYFDIDMNLAPVVDLRREAAARGLERRCFGADAATVIELAGAFMEGQESEGTASCLKHFPGIGAGSADPHYGTSVVDLPLSTLIAEDLAPYRELGAKAGAVMIGHSVYPQVAEDGLPATLSPVIATELLRNVVGFQGLAVSDDMEMHAVSDLGRYEEIAERALRAGNDMALFCSHIERLPELMDALARVAGEDEAFEARLADAIDHVTVYRRHCAGLRAGLLPVPSFEEILEDAERFCEAWKAARPESETPLAERRSTPRTPGTGKTGREEWT